MTQRFQYTSETGPIVLLPALAPKSSWDPIYPDLLPPPPTLTAACRSTQGTSTFVDWPIPIIFGGGGGPRLGTKVRYQYTSEVGPVFVPPKVPKHSWFPNFPDINPWSKTLPTACTSASGQFGHPEMWPVQAIVQKLSWGPEFPDFAKGPIPVPLHSDEFWQTPTSLIPLDAKFGSWRPDFPDIVRGRQPLVTYSEPFTASFEELIPRTSLFYNVRVFIDGTDYTQYVNMSGAEIEDLLNEQPNTCNFRIDPGGPVISGGEDIKITLNTALTVVPGGAAPHITIFGGTCTAPEQIYLGELRANVAYNVVCQGYEYLFNKSYPEKRYVSLPVDSIIIDLVSTYASLDGFTTSVSGLWPTVSIDFTGDQNLLACVVELINLGGGYCYVGYDKILRAFISSDGRTGPANIDETNASSPDGARNVKFVKDFTQVRTRANVSGVSSSIDVDTTVYSLPAGVQTVPLASQTQFFGATQAKIGPQIITFTGTSGGAGNATTVTGILQNPGAPTSIGQLLGSGTDPSGKTIGPSGSMDSGSYTYRMTTVNASGDESEVSTPSPVGSILPVNPPSPPSATYLAVAGDMLAGVYAYRATFKTYNGETAYNGTSNNVTIPTLPSPSLQLIATGIAQTGQLQVGSYFYAITFKTSNGETVAGPANGAPAVISKVSDSASSLSAVSSNVGGAGQTDNFVRYLITNLDQFGETAGSETSVLAMAAIGNNSATLSVGAATDARVTGRNLYRSGNFGVTYALVGGFSGAGAFSYQDNLSPLVLGGAPPPSNTTGSGQVQLSSIPVSTDPRVTARGVYRGANFGGPFFHITDIGNNTDTTLLDNIGSPEAVSPPTSSTADNGQVTLSNIGLTSDVRVIGRNLYRSEVNQISGAFGLALSIVNVTDTSHVDNIPDSSLGSASPTVSTADNGVMSLGSISLGGAGTISRNFYRTRSNGGSTWLLAFTIKDNSTISALDNTPDSSLGVLAPTGSVWRTPAGSTILPLTDLSRIVDAPGWVKVGSRAVYYTGSSGVSITGIPAADTPFLLGALNTDIQAGTPVVVMPFLKGVSGLIYPLTSGDSAALFVQVNDLTAQAALAALEGGNGIHVFSISDSTLTTLLQATKRGQAELVLFGYPNKTLTYTTRDYNTHSGADITINLGAPTNISVTLKIHRVVITEMGALQKTLPLFTVSASFTKYTLQDVLRQLAFINSPINLLKS